MEPTDCLKCGNPCAAVVLHKCDACGGGVNAYYWPCGSCGYDSNGAQCERKSNCANAIEHRRLFG